jgi:hypothetical protein
MGWAIHVARITEKKNLTQFWAENLNREDPCKNGRVILIRDLKEILLKVWTG